MNIANFNRRAWDNIANSSKRWFRPITKDEIERARSGDWKIRVTATKPVPRRWLEPIEGKNVLCLAGGGGRQGPTLAAAGARVTVFDLSDRQLELDQQVAAENDLAIETVQGDMHDLSCFKSGQFDVIVNPCSLNFCPEVEPAYREAYRCLIKNGIFIAGLINPINYLFDAAALENGEFQVRYKIPFCGSQPTTSDELTADARDHPIEFGHSLADLIGKQTAAGFAISGFFEDRWGGDDPVSDLIDVFIATRAIKL